MIIEIQTQEEMVDMAHYFLSISTVEQMSDFDKYCYSRDLIAEWNKLSLEQRVSKSHQIEIYGFNVKNPVWK